MAQDTLLFEASDKQIASAAAVPEVRSRQVESMKRWRMCVRGIAFALVILLLGACADVTVPTASESAARLTPPGRASHDYAEMTWDDCYSYGTCHLNGSYMSFDDYTGMDGYNYWDMYDCPRGCSTFPMGVKTTELARQALYWVDGSLDCQRVMGFVMSRIDTGHVRFYTMRDGDWGDYHPLSGEIHIHTDNFFNQTQLGVTLMHEGFHEFFNNPSDIDASDFSEQCLGLL